MTWKEIGRDARQEHISVGDASPTGRTRLYVFFRCSACRKLACALAEDAWKLSRCVCQATRV